MTLYDLDALAHYTLYALSVFWIYFVYLFMRAGRKKTAQSVHPNTHTGGLSPPRPPSPHSGGLSRPTRPSPKSIKSTPPPTPRPPGRPGRDGPGGPGAGGRGLGGIFYGFGARGCGGREPPTGGARGSGGREPPRILGSVWGILIRKNNF